MIYNYSIPPGFRKFWTYVSFATSKNICICKWLLPTARSYIFI